MYSQTQTFVLEKKVMSRNNRTEQIPISKAIDKLN